jgi:hypothetical protein
LSGIILRAGRHGSDGVMNCGGHEGVTAPGNLR